MQDSAAQHPQPIVVVTGPSGAGRSTAINALEDFGFETIDNMPLSLLPRLIEGAALDHPLALGIDVRTRDFEPTHLLSVLNTLASEGLVEPQLLFVDASRDVLLRRYSETRRRHPSAPDGSPLEGVDREHALLDPMRAASDILINTSELTPHDLRAELARWFANDSQGDLAVSLVSFSYKSGLPRGADLVFDCRFLQNPHWQEDLRPMNGQDSAVLDYVRSDSRFADFFGRLVDMSSMLLPAFKDEGKAHLTIAMGCTGGKHRSVAVTEELAKALANKGWRVSIRHREIESRAAGGQTARALGKTAPAG